MQGGGGGEVRRVHVVYFLSRHGEIEQPHLIRVRRRAPHRDGVRLRDVKRWLSELRGKGMPDSYSWSYKRRYRTGYVWQDLADDDLITPVSDNEYVLKGSLTAAASTRSSFSSSSSPTISSPSAPVAGCPSRLADTFHRGHPKPAPPPETPPARKPDCHDEEDRRRRADAVRDVDRSLRADAAAGPPPQASPCASCEIVEEGQPEDGAEEKKGVDPTSAPYCSLGQRRRSYAWCGGYGGRSPLLFRDLLRCGAAAAEVDDSALLPINPRRRGQPRRGGGGGDGDGEAIVLSGGSHRDPTEDGASGRCRGEEKSWSASRAGEAGGGEQKATAPAEANKLAKPSCSQCGRPFKPERLHSHMKSCRALKGQRKNTSSGKLPKEVEAQRAVLSEEASSFFLQSLVIR